MATLDYSNQNEMESDVFSFPKNKKKTEMTVSSYLDPNLIIFLKANSQNEALNSLVDLAVEHNIVSIKETFYRALLEREKIISTGIGMGVAIPHAKLTEFSDFFLVIGIQKQKGLNWKALDHSLVRLIFLIGGPENRPTEYLHLLSRLTMAIKKEEVRKALLQSISSSDVVKILQNF